MRDEWKEDRQKDILNGNPVDIVCTSAEQVTWLVVELGAEGRLFSVALESDGRSFRVKED